VLVQLTARPSVYSYLDECTGKWGGETNASNYTQGLGEYVTGKRIEGAPPKKKKKEKKKEKKKAQKKTKRGPRPTSREIGTTSQGG